MAVKVAINGFGRIGRLAFRQMFGAEGYEEVANLVAFLAGDDSDYITGQVFNIDGGMVM